MIPTRTILLALWILLACHPVFAADQEYGIDLGDAEARVIEVLGSPQGKARSGGADILFYERGTVELKAGKVSAIKLTSEKEAARKTEERLQREEKRRQAMKEQREQLIAEGTAEKERMLADPNYASMPARQTVDNWNDFKSKYPDVPIDTSKYQAALEELRVEKKEALRQAEVESASELPPEPQVSGKKKRKMKRAGTWVWD